MKTEAKIFVRQNKILIIKNIGNFLKINIKKYIKSYEFFTQNR